MFRLLVATRAVVFAYLAALIMAIGSERMFWFWSTGLGVHLEVAAYYSIATVVGIGLMRRFTVTSWWSLMLVAPVIAFIVEGVITPVIYTGGPMVPLFPAWFSFWHGMLAFVGLVFGIRHLLLRESTAALSFVAIAVGLFWGVWSSTQWLPENVNDPDLIEIEGGPLVVLEPAAFGLYATLFTAVLIVGHALIGFVWPRFEAPQHKLARWEKATIALVLIGVIGWTVVVPWALPMFGLYCWLQQIGLRWHRSAISKDQQPLLDQLQGRVRLRSLVPLSLVAPAAAGAYALMWTLDPSDDALRVVMYGTIAVQSVIGFAVAGKALLMARSNARRISSSSASSASLRVPSPSA